MPLRRYFWSLVCITMAGITFALFSCAKNPLIVDRNRPPRTFLVAAPIDSTIAHPTATGVSYSYRVHLYWRGEDPDGYVVGFLWAFDDSSAGHFHYTTKTDSIFDLTVNDSTDITGGATIIGSTRFHTFYIRAVDNLGKPDPNLIIYNRTTFKASTIRPHVRFIGGIPSGNGIDTLSDGQPFKICWTGDDSDGVVIRYKLDVGSYSSPLISDTCAYFNDTVPGSVGLATGVYNLTLTAVDNALAVGKTNLLFVVNHDPETWFGPIKGAPYGRYRAPFLGGTPADPTMAVPFAEGDTVPYRSTVWFEWDGEDIGRPGTPNNPNPESNCINGYSLELRGGTRNGANPYVIGFVDSIPASASFPKRAFKTNEPNYLIAAGFPQFVLDSLDEGRNMFILAASRDCSNRADGTKAAFRFNCNFPPFIDSLGVEDGYQGEPGKIITWFTRDPEDGITRKVKIKLDGFNIFTRETDVNQAFVADSTFARLSPSNPHSVEVWAIDRADIQSDKSLIVYFDLVPPGPTRRFTRRP